jgi:hypothetical protein
MATIKNAVFISLHFRCLGVSRKIDKSRVDTTADKTLVSVNKKLFQSDTFKRIKRIQTQARSYLLSRAVETGLRGAVYALPTEFVSDVEDQLADYVSQMKCEVATLCGEWPTLIEVTAREQLGDLYSENDYPSVAEVAQAFGIEWRYVSSEVPGELADISSGVFQRERDKLQKEFEKATEYTKAVMRRTCLEFVTQFKSQLQPTGSNGSTRKRPVHSSTLNKLTDFMETFNARNLSGDVELCGAVSNMRTLLSGVSVKDLRNSESFKSSLNQQMESTVANIESMVEECPVRQIIFDD